MERLKSAEAWAYYLSDLLDLDLDEYEDLLSDLNSDKAVDWLNVLYDEDVKRDIIIDFCEFFNITSIPYELDISFNGYIDSTIKLEIDGPYDADVEFLKHILFNDFSDELLDELELESIESIGSDKWRVTFTFGGYPDATAFYDVYAEDEYEAEEIAKDNSLNDFDILSFERL